MALMIDGGWIQNRREDMGLTRAQAELSAGMSYSMPGTTWRKFEVGEVRDPTVSTAAAIAFALKCHIDDFVKVGPKVAKAARKR